MERESICSQSSSSDMPGVSTDIQKMITSNSDKEKKGNEELLVIFLAQLIIQIYSLFTFFCFKL